MGRTENPSIWEKIQRNVQETERLIGQKKYNLAMIKARQTMEYMVKLHCDKAGIVESTPDTMIRELYGGKWISKSTAEHYLQILSIGEQAAKDGDNGAFNANQAYHLLSQEVYAFSNSDKPERTRRSAREASVSRGSDSSRAASSRAAAGSRTSSAPAVPHRTDHRADFPDPYPGSKGYADRGNLNRPGYNGSAHDDGSHGAGDNGGRDRRSRRLPDNRCFKCAQRPVYQ